MNYETPGTVDPHEGKKIFSMGHSNHPIDQFIGLLQLSGVTTLVDVCGSPSSKRYPQYNKQSLIASCSANNIVYRHCSQLGNKQHKIQTLIELPAGQSAVERLSEEYFASGANATAIMCSEQDSDTCHRKIVAQRLYDDCSINTKHISRLGKIRDHVVLDPNASRIRQAKEHDVGPINRAQTTLGKNYVGDPNASRIRQAKEHNIDLVESDTSGDGSCQKDCGEHCFLTSKEPIPKTQRSKSVIISVPMEAESYEVSESIAKKTHRILAKRSGGSLKAYLGNAMNYDRSRKFIEGYAIKAASQAAMVCEKGRRISRSISIIIQVGIRHMCQ